MDIMYACLFVFLCITKGLLLVDAQQLTASVLVSPPTQIKGDKTTLILTYEPKSTLSTNINVQIKKVIVSPNKNEMENVATFKGASNVLDSSPKFSHLQLESVDSNGIRLKFQPTNFSDSGSYQATFVRMSDFDTFMAAFSIDVQAYPGRPTITVNNQVATENDSNLMITCVGNVGKTATTGTVRMFTKMQFETVFRQIPNGDVQTQSVLNPDGTTTITASVFTGVVTYQMNKAIYRCQTENSLLSANEERYSADVTLNVQYRVRDVRITPVDTNVPRNSRIVCVASGNPEPAVTWERISGPVFAEIAPGVLQIPLTALPGTHEYRCNAKNTVNGGVAVINKSYKFNITALPTTIPPPTNNPTTPKTGTVLYASIGGVLGGLVLVALIILIIYFCCIRRRKQPPFNEDQEKGTMANNNAPVGKYDIDMDEKPATDPKHLNAENLVYADLAMDDTPRSRKPIQVIDDRVDYADIRRV
ncbi:uncharacterized protein LOC141906898 isoform X2 [Tubulanus polymorphus]|uniref:uncharacterized protein LOC141906898 isoform X2 n=1 Tax=Tubulanus polymorphus TaxID=672921 RepID=UPI003DA4B6C6